MSYVFARTNSQQNNCRKAAGTPRPTPSNNQGGTFTACYALKGLKWA